MNSVQSMTPLLFESITFIAFSISCAEWHEALTIRSLGTSDNPSVATTLSSLGIDGNNFTQQDFQIIQQLNNIIQDSGEIGEFELGNLKITINNLKIYENNLIKIK